MLNEEITCRNCNNKVAQNCLVIRDNNIFCPSCDNPINNPEKIKPKRSILKILAFTFMGTCTSFLLIVIIAIVAEDDSKITNKEVIKPTPKVEIASSLLIDKETRPNKQFQTQAQKQQAQYPQYEQYPITAVQLFNEYEANEVAADNKYKNKIVVVTGTIESIGKDIFDEAYIRIKAGGSYNGILCSFSDEYLNAFNKISKGQKITITGKVSGFMMGSVIVNDCSPQ